jgi:hypothetical protein
MSAFFLEHPKETDLALFAGGESGPFARWRIERHVESCPQCQQIAADFFRLPDQLNELADLPSLDWKQMAMAIESGVRADAAVGRRARRAGFLPPLAWQAGLAAATVVVGVVIVRQLSQPVPEPELVAVAKIEAPAPAYVGSDETLGEIVAESLIAVDALPERAEIAAAALQSKAVETRQTFASDIAAPAPPPPPAAVNETVARRVSSAAQPVAAEAESAEGRLRNDAAARVGAVSALAVSGQAGGYPEKAESVQRSVEAVNFAGAPLSVQSGYSLLSRVGIQTPRVVLRNETDKTISGFVLVWIVGDGVYQSRAQIVLQDLATASGEVSVTGGGNEWRSPSGASNRMRVYVSSVAFEDGTTWSPTTADIASKGLTAPAGVQELQALDHTF